MREQHQWAVEIIEERKEDGHDEYKSFLEDLTSHGCQSGIVGEVIYTSDCKELFIEHMDAILESLTEFEEDCGIHLSENISYDALPTKGVWFILEEVAGELLEDLEDPEEDDEEGETIPAEILRDHTDSQGNIDTVQATKDVLTELYSPDNLEVSEQTNGFTIAVQHMVTVTGTLFTKHWIWVDKEQEDRFFIRQ